MEFGKIKKLSLVFCLGLLVWAAPIAQGDYTPDAVDAIVRAADSLAAVQSSSGFWPSEKNFTGSIVPGLIIAYKISGDVAYLEAAELGGGFIIQNAEGNYFGDEVYALTRLSGISSDPEDNYWRTAAVLFYESVRIDPNSTSGYIEDYANTDPSNAVFYIAHHVVAAYYVDAIDKALWREGLISYLAQIEDDASVYPVLSLGVATWALAQTGPLDDTLVLTDPGEGQARWLGVSLADLPGLLLSHQVPAGEPYSGSFYWRFDHTDGDSQGEYPHSGYTEDTIYATLGLIAAAKSELTHEYDEAIRIARQVLPPGVYTDDLVYEHLVLQGQQKAYYAGELLQILCEALFQGDTVREAIIRGADRLVQTQRPGDPNTAFWEGETSYTGSLLLGLISAYEVAGKAAYQQAARLAGGYILSDSEGNYYGDETYALSRLSENSTDPDNNIWRTALSGFYESIRNDVGGTSGYLDSYADTNSSTAVFYVAHHVIVAYYVDAVDKALWRAGLIHYLAQIEDDYIDEFGNPCIHSKYPVLSLGIATWSLAQTGPLDNTPVLSNPAEGQARWLGVTLADLPGLLLSHQVPAGDPYAGSFYWRFDHTDGDPIHVWMERGYTEDAVYGTLGLVAAAQSEKTHNYDSAIRSVRMVLPIGVYANGDTSEHIYLQGVDLHYYAGELLQALCAVSPAGDGDDDGDVDLLDLSNFTNRWLEEECKWPLWCGYADIDHLGSVNSFDFALLSNHWLVFTGE